MTVVRRKAKGNAGFPLIEMAEILPPATIKVTFEDGYVVEMDLSGELGRRIWKDVKTFEDLCQIKIEQFGSNLSWGGDVCVLPADGIRWHGERQLIFSRGYWP